MTRINHEDGSFFLVLPDGRVMYQKDASSQPVPMQKHIEEQAGREPVEPPDYNLN